MINSGELFKFGLHDTEITSISINKSEIKIHFDNGVYLLNELGRETTLTDAMILVLNINPNVKKVENCFEIREISRKIRFINLECFEKQLKKEPYSITMHYYSEFNHSILFEGGFSEKQIFLSIEEIDNIQFIK